MVVEGKRRTVHYDESSDLRKGPWKAEEDEVLINHVKRYGPRDWSSIRSKGLLQRTGKSCRLRWVNKLRPNLKNGVKFSADEERTVIELQAQFGNKWARIATYLSGRTDNDVKNFWSSRQKRLARILQTSSAPPSCSSKSQKDATIEEIKVPSFLDVPSMEAPKFTSSSTEEEPMTNSQSCSSSHIGNPQPIKMVPPLPELIYPISVLSYNELNPFQFDYTPPEKKPSIADHSQSNNNNNIPFPSIPQLQSDFPLPLESHEFMMARSLGDPNSFLDDVFDHSSAQLPIVPTFFGHDDTTSSEFAVEKREIRQDVVTPDSFMDDFPPIDMFDQLEPLPSPSDWS